MEGSRNLLALLLLMTAFTSNQGFLWSYEDSRENTRAVSDDYSYENTDYMQEYYDNNPIEYVRYNEGEIPAGAASLAFVFDITGSMYDDLVQVIEGAAKILATTLSRRDKPLYNYVLVPFHDPEIGPITVTTDPDKYQRDLRELYVQGGGDCPEMSVGAIKAALEECLPNSFIYVFTDARSKDYHLTEKVLTLIQQKQSQVVFVMTGDCGNTSHPGYKAYEQIASTSSGQVFLLKKSQVNQILDWVRVALQPRKVNLMSIDRTEANASWQTLPVDGQLQEFTISISGYNPEVEIIDPSGYRLKKGRDYEELLNIAQALIVNIKSPRPGIWKLKMTADKQHTIRMTGLSVMNFQHGFSRTPTLDLSLTEARPIKGVPTHLLLNSTSLEYPGQITSVELLDLVGNTLLQIPVRQTPGHPELYNLTAFMPPDEFFYIKVSGLDDLGHEFRRMSLTAINALEPAAPAVTMDTITKGYYDKPATLICAVDSIVPFSVQWMREAEKVGTPLFYTESYNSTYTIPDASSFTEGVYRCNASNAAGWTLGQTYLDVKDPPPSILKPTNVSVLPGYDVMMTCVARSTVDFNMTWLGVNGKPLPPSRAVILNNGSLSIRRVELSDEGPYICRAQNEGGYTDEKVHLLVQKAPLVNPNPSWQTFTTGSTVTIGCGALAYPAPTYVWKRYGKVLPARGLKYSVARDGTLTVRDLQRADSGQYECVATNLAGTGSGHATLTYIEKPKINVREKLVLVNNGDTATLQCIAEGIPAPNVTWYRGTIQLSELSFIEIRPESGELVVLGVQDMDAGQYTCVASNDAGSTQETIDLQVGSAPVIVAPPSSQGVDILENATLPCRAVGVPMPTITWTRQDGRPVVSNGNTRFTKLDDGSLFIRGINKSDEGLYTCRVENQFGVQQMSAFISVTGIVSPLIAYSNPRIESIVGRRVQLNCVVLLGNPKPTITWLKMGEVVPVKGDGSQLVIDKVDLKHEGEYTCMASNVGGSATHITELDVQIPPHIADDGTKDFTAIQGHSIKLPCQVTGDPKPLISWTKNGVRITETDPHYFMSGDGSLEIFSADPQDTATYSCTAINIAGLKEKRMTLYVQIPPQISPGPDEYIVIINNPIQIPCEAHGIPEPTTKWLRDGKIPGTPEEPEGSGEVEEGVGVVFLDNGYLRFPSVKVGDAGLYECVASSAAGNTTKMVMLTVQVPPRIRGKERSSELVALVGDNVTLPCEVIGTPWPQIKWKKDLRTIDFFNTNHKHHIEEAGSLYLPGVEVSDTGRFLCIAENPAGVVTKEISLIVHAIPHIPEDTPTAKDVIEGNRVVLPCPAQGTPAPLVTWYKAGKEVSANEIGVRLLPDGGLQLEHAEAQNAGQYECIATNVAGNDSHMITLTVYMPPRFMGEDGELIVEEVYDKRPESLAVMVNRTTRLLCDVAAHPPPQITWYKNDKEVKESPRVKLLKNGKVLEIIGADVKDTARYMCVARNLAGETEKSFDLDIQVPPSIDERLASPYNMTVLKDGAVIIDCPINGVPNPDITWYKDGLQLQVEFDPNLRLLNDGKRLEIRSAYVTDTGEYKCYAKNDAGEVDRKFLLNVWVPAQIDGSGEVSKPEVVVNKTITLHCPATGIPPPKVSWFRDGKAIDAEKSGKRWLIEDDGYRIRLAEASVDDAARYSCLAKNVAGQNEKYYDLSVLVPPYIDRFGMDVTPEVVENRTVVLSCPAEGLPNPMVRWLRNGEVLSTQLPDSGHLHVLAEGRQLRVKSSSLTDAGTYTCEASNKAGKDSQDFRLSVHIPAYIERGGLELNPKVVENRSHVLECPVEGIPSPSITWTKDGTEIDFQMMVGFAIGASGQKLVIQRAKVDQTGQYECIAENDAGTDRMRYSLEVYVPPFIIAELSSEPEPRVIINKTLTLNCEVRGVPEPEIKWLVNGRPLIAQSSDDGDERIRFLQGGKTLEISDVGVPDTGRYTCVATNNAGVADRDFDLQVWVPPYIDSNNLDLEPEVVQGKYITLNCPAMGIPFPDVEWYKDGRPVDDQSNRIRFLLSRRQLEIQGVDEEDKATYTCRATNVAGMAELAFALDIWVPPSIDDANVVDKPKVIENRTVLLECPVSGVPPPKVTWLRNGEKLDLENHMRLLSDGRSLEIQKAQESDTARYTCIASNQAGQLEQNFHLQILVPATIEGGSGINRIEAVENSTIYLDCPTRGIPAPSIMWLKDGMPLLDFPYQNVRELSSGQKLEVRNVQVADEGRYMCQATNVAGQQRKIFRLKVLVPPRIPEGLLKKELAVVERRPVRMECYPEGDPTPTIVWSKDGEELKDGSVSGLRLLRGGRILQIGAATIDVAGAYTCTATNIAGTDSKQYVLEVQVPPKIEDSLRIEGHSVIIGDSLSVHCNATGVPEPKLSWQRDGQPLSMLTNPNLRVTEDGHKLTIYNAQLLDIGGYTCRAENVAGHTQKEFLVNVLVPPSIEDVGESVVAATVNSRTQLRCEALGLPEPEVTWYKDGERIPDSGSNYRTHRSGTLEFSGVKKEDSGAYRCVAKNPAGQADRNMTLTVQVPPKLVSDGPVTVTSIAGTDAFLPCEATGLPKPTIVWQKANRILTDDSLGYVLSEEGVTVEETEPSDAGIYICMAQNNAGTALGQVRLEVQVPPTIESQQEEFEVLQDREIMLPCRATGLPVPRVTWKKNGQPIAPSDYRFRVTRSGWLAIAIARTDDTAEFTCVAENAAGTATLNMQLQVHVPPSIKETVRSLTVNEGEVAKLMCDNSGFPKPTISWIQDGRIMIEDGGRYVIEDSGALTIRSAEVRDTGSFVCTAKNKAGRDKKEVVLKVQVPPQIVTYPKDQEVTANNHIVLECEATGVPTPVITWKVNGTHYPSAPSMNGRSRLEIDNAVRSDDGTYMCIAENPAGLRRALAAVRVKVPPRVMISPSGGSAAVTLAQRVILDCPVLDGENALIHWTKAGRPVLIDERIMQLDNGSLVIYDANADDEGNYRCTATNEAGSDSGSAFLTVRSPPEFKVEPHDSKIFSGDSLVMNCVAEGEPKPSITWRKESIVLENGVMDRITILPNDSLSIVAAQEEDAGTYICFAKNPLGKILKQAVLTVAVNGHWSSWATWSSCTVSCGNGEQMRKRVCDNPTPKHGGRECRGQNMQARECMTNDCPVNGNWGDWSPWLPCSKSCDHGKKVRQRLCNNPSPQNGGERCSGLPEESMMCNSKPCPVDGGWGTWTDWRPCTETCGDGVQERYRRCDDPRPQYGGHVCTGLEIDRKSCNLRDCAHQGNWGDWSGWSLCSLSCGGGKRSRVRACDSPPPSIDGLTCPGQDQQVDFCNKEACPVHGNWGQWTRWGDCTMSCGGGQRKRFRMCDSPAPKANGRPCIGPGQDTQLCNMEACAVDGTWTTWTQWTRCSLTCGSGAQTRERQCQQPQHGGALCRGNPGQSRSCNTLPCGAGLPQRALGNIAGTINGREFGPNVLNASISRTGQGTQVTATLLQIPGEIGRYLQHLVSLLSPIYWTTATEVGEAVNGFTLTEGHFQRNVHVQFATGEVLKMLHIARGVDSQGVLHVDIALNGEVPTLPDTAQIIVLPYTEDYIQTGPDSLYATSSRMFKVDGFSLPYAWNHTITYDSKRGRQPFLVQRLTAEDLFVDFDVSKEVLQYQLTASIAKGVPSNQCPIGFMLQNDYCTDRNECRQGEAGYTPCSHGCSNTPGSFSCFCPAGMSLAADGRICKDVDECELGIAECHVNQDCLNTIGSFRCAIKCRQGFHRAANNLDCEDENECRDSPRVCEQQCQNEVGGYRCSCRRGYTLVENGKCQDIDECRTGSSMCSHYCHNTDGAYKCSCPAGFVMIGQGQCRDIDECREGRHSCDPGDQCKNTEGSYECERACPRGYDQLSNGTCTDRDECRRREHMCHFNQQCVNTEGAYMCQCQRGYRTDGPGRPCVDVDECAMAGRCQDKCINTAGSYRCTCPTGYRLAANKRTCQDIDECEEQNVNCGENKMCFNRLGDFACVDTGCPDKYDRDPRTGYCVLECSKSDVPCQRGARYADILQFRMVALRYGIPAYQDLIHLIAYNQYGEHLPQTTFTMLDNDPDRIPFGIRVENGKGVVFTIKPLEEKTQYRIKVRAKSYDNNRRDIQYQTTFVLFISVSAFPY